MIDCNQLPIVVQHVKLCQSPEEPDDVVALTIAICSAKACHYTRPGRGWMIECLNESAVFALISNKLSTITTTNRGMRWSAQHQSPSSFPRWRRCRSPVVTSLESPDTHTMDVNLIMFLLHFSAKLSSDCSLALLHIAHQPPSRHHTAEYAKAPPPMMMVNGGGEGVKRERGRGLSCASCWKTSSTRGVMEREKRDSFILSLGICKG